MTTEARVLLGPLEIGVLRVRSDSGTEFVFLDTYVEAADAPVLGQAFLDNPRQIYVGRSSRLPSFFRNLLPDPDGKNRAHVAASLGLRPHQEFEMVCRMGRDLPGAVSILPEAIDGGASESSGPDPEPGSLAGMQPKFSAARRGATLRMPVHGRGEYFIVKPPDVELEGIPENEFSMMTWAAKSGLSVAGVDLVPVDRIPNLPRWLTATSGMALVVKRFDRSDDGKPIHIEDMAQVWGLEPDEKYEQRHYASIAKLLLVLGRRPDFDEMVRRIVFMALSGNADGHLKNWSLIYPDGRHANLAPAYDFVSTIQYPQFDNSGLALKLRSAKRWSELSESVFFSFGERVGVPGREVIDMVREYSERAIGAWKDIRGSIPMPEDQKKLIETHWTGLPFLVRRRS